jgi:hypothetical protein
MNLSWEQVLGWRLRRQLLDPVGEVPVTDVGASYLSLVASARTWEKASWQRTFVSAAELERIAEAAYSALENRILSREQLLDLSGCDCRGRTHRRNVGPRHQPRCCRSL